MVHPIVIRADSSANIGAGHVLRSVALAQRFDPGPSGIHLVSTDIVQGVREWLEANQVVLHEIEPKGLLEDAAHTAAIALELDAQLLILDHYGLEFEWETALSPKPYLLVIDDIDGRHHHCDALVDPTLGFETSGRHDDLRGMGTLLFIGQNYALLRSEFDPAENERSSVSRVGNILVFLGGGVNADDIGPIIKALDTIIDEGLGVEHARVILGRAFENPEMLVRAGDPRVEIISSTDDMISMLRWADLAIGATGGAQWERCAAGLPTLLVQTHPNQAHDMLAFCEAGVAKSLGPLSALTEKSLADALRAAVTNVSDVNAMASRASKLMNGRQQALNEAVSRIAQGVHSRAL